MMPCMFINGLLQMFQANSEVIDFKFTVKDFPKPRKNKKQKAVSYLENLYKK